MPTRKYSFRCDAWPTVFPFLSIEVHPQIFALSDRRQGDLQNTCDQAMSHNRTFSSSSLARNICFSLEVIADCNWLFAMSRSRTLHTAMARYAASSVDIACRLTFISSTPLFFRTSGYTVKPPDAGSCSTHVKRPTLNVLQSYMVTEAMYWLCLTSQTSLSHCSLVRKVCAQHTNLNCTARTHTTISCTSLSLAFRH